MSTKETERKQRMKATKEVRRLYTMVRNALGRASHELGTLDYYCRKLPDWKFSRRAQTLREVVSQLLDMAIHNQDDINRWINEK